VTRILRAAGYAFAAVASLGFAFLLGAGALDALGVWTP
jgi:hypothetical protein